MHSTRLRTSTGIVAAVLTLSVGGCLGPTEGIRTLAMEYAQEEFDELRGRLQSDLQAAPPGDLGQLIADGSLRFDRSFVGMSDDEIRAERLGGRRQSVLLDVSEGGAQDRLTVLLLTTAETGGGWSHNQTVAYTCWEIEVDVGSRRLGDHEDVPCPPAVREIIGSAVEFSIDDLDP